MDVYQLPNNDFWTQNRPLIIKIIVANKHSSLSLQFYNN